MQITTCQWISGTGWSRSDAGASAPQLVLYFGATSQLDGGAEPVRELVAQFPNAVVCGCSTAGEILGNHVSDESVVAALVQFKSTRVRAVAEVIASNVDSRAVGCRLAEKLNAPDLRHVLVLSDGLAVNGTALVEGIRAVLSPDVAITGGLAGDGARFQKTFVGLGQEVKRGQIVVVGFYGKNLLVSYGSRVGGEGFGPRRRITRSEGNILLELDGQPALALYKRYLGERAGGLPGTGLLFPLELTKDTTEKTGLARTLLSVDEARQSITFAGDVPEGWYVRLMKASGDQFVAGAASAGGDAALKSAGTGDALAILVSCVGRRLVLGQRIEEELEAVNQAFPARTVSIGFYSYGEACPAAGHDFCELHNQTMTITVLGEKE